MKASTYFISWFQMALDYIRRLDFCITTEPESHFQACQILDQRGEEFFDEPEVDVYRDDYAHPRMCRMIGR
jgi:hypothetical protein